MKNNSHTNCSQNVIIGTNGKKYKDDAKNVLLVEFKDTAAEQSFKKKLTVYNKSVGYQLQQAKKDLMQWTPKQDFSAYAAQKVDKAKATIEELEGELMVQYFYDPFDEKMPNKTSQLLVPAGFWYLCENIENKIHMNTEVEPFYLKGNREYQDEMTKEMLKYKRATGVLATGLGKTRVITTMCLSFLKKQKRCIIIVPTQSLVDQFVNSVKQFHESVTGAYTGKKPKLGTDILVTTVGTAEAHIDKFDVVFIDESHHASASTWYNLLSECTSTDYVYNVTATPMRADGLDIGIHAFGGPIVYDRDLVWGIENNFLENYDAYIVHNHAWKKRNNPHGSLFFPKQTMRAVAYKNIVSNQYFLENIKKLLIKTQKVDNQRKVLVLFGTLRPAERLKSLCTEPELAFRVANSKFKKPLHDFQQGKVNILVATNKLVGEGIDIPDIDVLVLCTQNSADGVSLQALGRMLRKKTTGRKPILFDIVARGYEPFHRAATTREKIWQASADCVKKLKI